MEKAQELIEHFAEARGISIEEAREKIGADTEDEIMRNITNFTIEKINQSAPKLNRAQRRALAKKHKGKGKKFPTPQEQMDEINETAKKLNYIDLIQKLRKLNEEKAKENEDEAATEDN